MDFVDAMVTIVLLAIPWSVYMIGISMCIIWSIVWLVFVLLFLVLPEKDIGE